MASSLTLDISETRRLYLTALQANRKAKTRLHNLQDVTSIASKCKDQTTSPVLLSHLQASHFRIHHARIQALSRSVARMEQIAEEHQVFDIRTTENTTLISSSNGHKDISSLTTEFDELTKQLELAVVNANTLLQSQKRQTEKLHFQIPYTDTEDNVSMFRALTATRAGLTAWLESSVVICDTTPDTTSTESWLSRNSPGQSDIDERYEIYNKVRAELVSAAANIPQSTFAIPLTREHAKSTAIQTVVHDSMLAQLDSEIQPVFSHLNHVEKHQQQLDKNISELTRQFAAEINHLRDESHLLLSHPILRDQPVHKEGRGLGGLVSSEAGEIDKLLKHWGFAHDAAMTAANTAIDTQFTLGNKASETTNESLEIIRRQEEAWKSLDS